MNRRNFFKRFGGLIATVAVAQQLVKSLVIEKVEALTPTRYKPNPAYADAPYEVAFILTNDVVEGTPPIGFTPLIFSRSVGLQEPELKEGQKLVRETYPVRFDADGNFVSPQVEV